MTIIEFEAWVSDHYEELVSAAERATKDDHRAVDLLHELIESVCEGRTQLPKKIYDLAGWFGFKLRDDLADASKRDATRGRVTDRLAASLLVLGPGDTFADTERSKRAQAQRRRREAAKRGSTVGTEGIADVLIGNPGGTARWRYQQLRDGRLFDERAVRSLADSMHRASQRRRHFGWPGFSHTEFGTEEVSA